MQAPFFSTFTLFTEIVITLLVLTIFYKGYFKNKFPKQLVIVALTYEILFNITYMVNSALHHVQNEAAIVDTPFETGLAIFHGTLSLIMFIGLVIFLVVSWRNFNKGINYFEKHKTLTIIFIVFWLLAVISGVLFYFVLY